MRSHAEFTEIAVRDLTPEQAQRVGRALDVAILFGVLEYLDGNESLHMDRAILEEAYVTKLASLKRPVP